MSEKLYVGGLAWATTDQTLRDHFAAVAEVASASVITDRDSGRSRGFGFVELANPEETQNVIDKLNGSDLEGRNISVSVARPKSDQPRKPFQRRGGNGGGFGGRGGHDNNRSW